MRKRIKRYGFPKGIVSRIVPIIDEIDRNNIADAESKFAALTLDICDSIEKETIPPNEGDAYFTLLDLIIGDRFPDLKLSQETNDILIEGMMLHDYGEYYGANLDTLRMLAKRIKKKSMEEQ